MGVGQKLCSLCLSSLQKRGHRSLTKYPQNFATYSGFSFRVQTPLCHGRFRLPHGATLRGDLRGRLRGRRRGEILVRLWRARGDFVRALESYTKPMLGRSTCLTT